MNIQLTLPPLDEECPHCTGPEADALRAENRSACWAWRDNEIIAFDAWVAERRARGNINAWDPDAWRCTEQYRQLDESRPDEMPDKGCVECDWVGRVPTDAGRQLLAFLATHTGGDR